MNANTTTRPAFTVGESLVYVGEVPEKDAPTWTKGLVSFRRMLGWGAAEVMTSDGSRSVLLSDLALPDAVQEPAAPAPAPQSAGDERRAAVVDRVRGELLNGMSFHYVAESHASADRMNYAPMVARSEYAAVLALLARLADESEALLYVVEAARGRISAFLTPHQIVAALARQMQDTLRETWLDVRSSTGPNPGPESIHRHEFTMRDRLICQLAIQEVGYLLRGLGQAPGVGWALREIVEQESLRVPQTVLPNVARALDGR